MSRCGDRPFIRHKDELLTMAEFIETEPGKEYAVIARKATGHTEAAYQLAKAMHKRGWRMIGMKNGTKEYVLS